MSNELVQSTNWNEIEDQMDLDVWNRVTANIWLDTKIPLSNDIPSWATLTPAEKESTVRVLMGLTLLDSIQSRVGMVELMKDAVTPHEEAVYGQQCFMEHVHAKSYSSIFSTLISKKEIEEAFRWSRENTLLQNKSKIIQKYYNEENPLKKKVTSVFLESFLFYSGFYLPLYWSSRGKLTNTADIIRLILRDESIHGFYIGYKFQKAYALADTETQNQIKTWAYEFLQDLYDNEVEYTETIYDQLGLTEDVKKYIRYNANKALSNLGFDPLFPKELCDADPAILSALSTDGGENHDFFSGSGSTYVMGNAEATDDSDWDF